jgi:hypothetical protein
MGNPAKKHWYDGMLEVAVNDTPQNVSYFDENKEIMFFVEEDGEEEQIEFCKGYNGIVTNSLKDSLKDSLDLKNDDVYDENTVNPLFYEALEKLDAPENINYYSRFLFSKINKNSAVSEIFFKTYASEEGFLGMFQKAVIKCALEDGFRLEKETLEKIVFSHDKRKNCINMEIKFSFQNVTTSGQLSATGKCAFYINKDGSPTCTATGIDIKISSSDKKFKELFSDKQNILDRVKEFLIDVYNYFAKNIIEKEELKISGLEQSNEMKAQK